MYDILIKNGTVIDGAGDMPVLCDVAVESGQVAAIGNLGAAKAKRVIDAVGRFVTPGFVDIQNHSDSYLTFLEMPAVESLVTQGVTTIAVGQCGSSLAPLPSPEALKSIQKWRSLAGANLNWLTFQEYLKALQNYKFGVNIVSLAGHSTIRRGLLGDQVRAATPEEIKIMSKVLKDSMTAGAGGLSLGLMYAHEVDSTIEELRAVVNEVSLQNKMVSIHLRSEGSHVVAALGEAISLVEGTRARCKISHFKVRGANNWGYIGEALNLLDRAYQRGVDIVLDVYPYTTSWTVLYTYLPKWAYEGGRAAILKNLQNREMRSRILAYLREHETNLGNIFIATSETNPSLVGKTLSQVAANQEVSVEEALLNVLTATNAQVIVFDHNLSEDIVEVLLKHPLSIVATDGAGYDFSYSPDNGLVHPRCFGAMPKFLAMVRDKKLMSWPDAIKKMTSKPAEKLGLSKRGKLLAGYAADIVIFNPQEIANRATYENPYQESDGLDYVLVNGEIAYAASDVGMRATSGKVIKL